MEFIGNTITNIFGFDSGALLTSQGNNSVQEKVTDLLLTVKGSMPHLPDYGCDLHKLEFHVKDTQTAQVGLTYIFESIREFMPEFICNTDKDNKKGYEFTNKGIKYSIELLHVPTNTVYVSSYLLQ
jgi:hypothetical protein